MISNGVRYLHDRQTPRDRIKLLATFFLHLLFPRFSVPILIVNLKRIHDERKNSPKTAIILSLI